MLSVSQIDMYYSSSSAEHSTEHSAEQSETSDDEWEDANVWPVWWNAFFLIKN